MRRIFIDLEMNMIPKRNWGQARQLRREIIEIGAVMLDESNAETASFKRFVKPQFAEKIAELKAAGVTPKDPVVQELLAQGL